MKTLYLPFSRIQTWLKSSSKALLPAALLLGSAHNAQAQFPRNETFRNATAPNFTLSGAARFTGTGAAGDDAVGQGYLRLTSNAINTAGSIVDNVGFDAPDGFTISFEFFAYGGTGADGFSVFLVDEAGQPSTGVRIGASGGSLGYAQKTVAPVAPGVSRGYIGIGIDEFGNYANPSEGRVGGPGPTPDAVSIRGAGDGSSATDYPYITGTALNQLGFSLDVPTARAQAGSPDYRRAFIDVVPTGAGTTRTYRITVRIQNGNVVTTTVDNVNVSTPPDRLRLGFSGSTGGSTNFHEIRNLNLVQAPFANDDLAATRYDQPVTINAISNDIFPGTGFQLGSLDLDFGTAGVQNTFTVPGGTFTADANGQVTFTPTGNFAGTITIPYTVSDILNQTTSTSSPANITIVVQGADVATNVSGPASANPGSTITYSVSTSNLGPVTASNVAPTLQLTPNLPAGSVTPSSGSYNAATGLVTFDPISSLTSGAAPVVNTVALVIPPSGTSTITGVAAATNTIPDPVTANNTATINTTVTGIANVSTACATPGKDGPLTVSTADRVVNTYYAGNQTVAATSTTVRVAAASQGAATPIAAGDVVLIMQMQGADLNVTNTDAYGDGTAGGASGNLTTNLTAGRYEYAIVASTTTSGANTTLTLKKGLTYGYENVDFAGITGTQTGQRRFQVIRVPQYSTLTIAANSSLTGAAWNGNTGGVLILDVAGKTIFSGATSSLNMTAKGFRGGGGKRHGGNTAYSVGDVRTLAAGANGSKGEGIAGTPRYVYQGGNSNIDNNIEGYVNGSNAQGAPGNAGGGATDGVPGTNSGNAGGGGGGNAGAGGLGGYASNTAGTGTQASGGAAFAGSSSLLIMGGGGGAGSNNGLVADEHLSSGGIGGGIIILRTGSVTGTGTVTANGGAALGTGQTDGGGGGGAGGTVMLLATPPTGVAPGLNGLTVNVAGGRGGDARTSGNAEYGPGGGGGGGYIFASSGLASSSIIAGTNGQTRASTVAFGATAGGAGIPNTATSAATPNTVAGAGGCLPTLTVGLRTSTPTRNRTGGPGGAVNPALYTLTVSNTGGEASALSILAGLPANVFSYDNSFTPQVTLTLADNTTGTPNGFTSLAGGSTPTFGLTTLPAGATISITFRATIAATANDGQAYQAGGSVTYSNPLRTTVDGTIQPGGNYAGGTDATSGAAGGSNYTATSSTAEDVTITRPLPVELKRFDAKAAGLNAELTWATASELQNDHFTIERSLDGHSFEQIGIVKGQGTSAHETAYRYTDAGAGRLSLKSIYYRLRQVDLDGTSSYSPVRIVRFERGSKAAIALYPNPHQGTAMLDLTALPSLESQVEVLDLSGRVVGKFQLIGGLAHPLNLNALPLGSYLIRVRNAETVITLPMIRN